MSERRDDTPGEEHPAADHPSERELEEGVEARREGPPGYDMAEEEAYEAEGRDEG